MCWYGTNSRWRCPNKSCETGVYSPGLVDSTTENAADNTDSTLGDTPGRFRASGPVKEISKELGCNWHTVNKTLHRWGKALLDEDTERIAEVTAVVGLG